MIFLTFEFEKSVASQFLGLSFPSLLLWDHCPLVTRQVYFFVQLRRSWNDVLSAPGGVLQ